MSSKKYGPNGLKGFRNYRVKPVTQSQAILKYLSSLNCPRALTIWLMFTNNEHEQLARLEFNPSDYLSSSEVGDAYLATKFLSKFKGLSLDYDLDQVAMNKFSEFEILCKQTNSRFRNLSLDRQFTGRVVWLHNAIIRKIDRLLGEFSPEEFFSMPDWGPGASTTLRRRDACSASKFQNEIGITRDLYSLISARVFEETYPHWHSHLAARGDYPCFEVGNRVVTVPKDATTNRVIAIEPGINLWFQKSLGEMIGRRLRRVGIDLRDQTKNQRFAKKGSKDSSVATVDLSSASDSIAYSVVEALLPPRWFTLLDTCRSQYGSLNGRVAKWEKFSSMGNGFTFQLESLIFYAITYCCAEFLRSDTNCVSVYGDDIIVPTDTFSLLSEILAFYGFRVNEKKSHFNSSFRESCGAHYISGFDIKPVYLKDELSTVGSVYRLANSVRRLASRQMNHLACDSRFRPVFDYLVASVPMALRLRIPEQLGDGGFICNFDEATPIRARHGIEGYRVWHLTDRSKTTTVEYTGYLLASYWLLSKRDLREKLRIPKDPSIEETLRLLHFSDHRGEGRNSVPLHDTVVQLSNSIVSGWSDLGPWI